MLVRSFSTVRSRLRPRPAKGVCGGELALLFMLIFGGCVYDANHRCGPHEQLDGDGACVCVAGFIPNLPLGRCDPCKEHEMSQGTACVCVPGYGKVSADAVCTPLSSGVGDACGATMSCTIAPYTSCTASRAGDSYCTSSGCSTSSDCATGFTCDTTRSPHICHRPASGQGKACQSADDCQGQDANFCESFQSHVCLVDGCNPANPSACDDGWKCCDVTHLGLPKTLCVFLDACP